MIRGDNWEPLKPEINERLRLGHRILAYVSHCAENVHFAILVDLPNLLGVAYPFSRLVFHSLMQAGRVSGIKIEIGHNLRILATVGTTMILLLWREKGPMSALFASHGKRRNKQSFDLLEQQRQQQ
jgi:hypothetical protein